MSVVRRLCASLPAVVVAAYVVAATWLVSGSSRWAHVVCPFRTVTGLDCPGCGSTRSTAALVRGDVVEAFDRHLLAPPVLAAVVVVAARAAFAPWCRSPWQFTMSRTTLFVALGVVAVFTVARNMPLFAVLSST